MGKTRQYTVSSDSMRRARVTVVVDRMIVVGLIARRENGGWINKLTRLKISRTAFLYMRGED